MQKRAVALFAVSCIAFLGIIARVYSLAVSDGIVQAGDRQSSQTVTVATVRGTIYDTRLRPLVNETNENRYSIFPKKQDIAKLTTLLTVEERNRLESLLKQNSPFVFSLDRLLPVSGGMRVFSVPVRYGEHTLASHVVGYLGADGHGVSGAERVFDEVLSTATGRASVTYRVDGAGEWLMGDTVTKNDTLSDAKAGVVLTIDRDVQIIAERVATATLSKGAVVVMSPQNGHILAMVSRPDFEPTAVGDVLQATDAPLINRALVNYNCGSVFKIVTSAAALESGVSYQTAYTCLGSTDVGDVTFGCHHALGHGTVDMFGGFAESCNPYYIQLADRVGAYALRDMAQTLGFSRALTIAPSWQTESANLPSLETLQSPAAVANLSFGQGELLATPVHVAQLVSAVVNRGKIVAPTIFKGFVDASGYLEEAETIPPGYAFSTATAVTLKQMMIEVVENGLGSSAKPSVGSAGGKTGTAQTGMVGANGEELLQNWFAGFYPAVSPKYVVVVVSEDFGSTGDAAAPVFREICEQLAKLSD